MPIIEIESQEQFDKIIMDTKDQKYILCDFWAKWCRPCNKIMPTLEEFSKIYGDKILFIKVNIDQHPTLTQKYSIIKLPTFIIFNNGSLEVNHQPLTTSKVEVIEDKCKQLFYGIQKKDKF